MAGYFVKKRHAPLALVPLQGGSRAIPFTFEISLGVKKGEQGLKAELEEVLARKATDIQSILEEYGVPLVAAEATQEERAPEKPREGHKHGEGAHRH
jgi:mxaJ protein